MESTLEHIAEARARLARAHEFLSTSGLRVLQLLSRRARAQQLLATLTTLAAVSTVQASLQQLLAAGEYVAALDLIDETQLILRTKLVGVHCLRFAPMILLALPHITNLSHTQHSHVSLKSIDMQASWAAAC